MSTTPTGEVGIFLDGIMDHLANSSSFQSWFGADDAAVAAHEGPGEPTGEEIAAIAKEMINIGDIEPSDTYPYVCIFPDALQLECSALGMAATYGKAFIAYLCFWGSSETDDFFAMDNNMSGLINDMISRGSSGVGPTITRVEYFPPKSPNPSEGEDYWYSQLAVISERS